MGAYNIGIRLIGGCCGFEPYHIRAMAEELLDVRGKLPVASAKSDYDLSLHKELEKVMPRYKGKGDLSYWMDNHPCTGRPLSTAMHPQLVDACSRFSCFLLTLPLVIILMLRSCGGDLS